MRAAVALAVLVWWSAISPAPTRTGSSCGGASLLAKTPPKTRAATISARHSPTPRTVARAFTDNLVVRKILSTSTSTTRGDGLQYKVAGFYSKGGGRLGCYSPICREGFFSETCGIQGWVGIGGW